MNAYDLIRKWISETLNEYEKAKKEGDFWKCAGLKRLYNLLREIQDQF